MPQTAEEALEEGRAAWRNLRLFDKTWNNWTAVGVALVIGRTECMREAGVNEPRGRGYNKLFSRWLRMQGFAEIDAAARSRLLDCMDHRAEIEMFRANLSLDVRLRLNHPNTVWRRWKKSHIMEEKNNKKKSADEIDAATERLHHQVDVIECMTGGSAALMFDMSPEYIANSADNFIEIYGKENALKFAQILFQLLEVAEVRLPKKKGKR